MLTHTLALQQMGLPNVTDIRLGGLNAIGTMDSPADGLTPSNGNVLSFTTNHALPANPPYNADDDLPLISCVKKNQGKLALPSDGNSTVRHLRGRLFKSMACQAIEGCGIAVVCMTWADTGSFVHERDPGVFNKSQAGSDIFMDRDYGDNQRSEGVIAVAHAEFVRTAIMSGAIQ